MYTPSNPTFPYTKRGLRWGCALHGSVNVMDIFFVFWLIMHFGCPLTSLQNAVNSQYINGIFHGSGNIFSQIVHACQNTSLSTHNPCFWAKIRKIMYTPVNPFFSLDKVKFTRVFITQTCKPDGLHSAENTRDIPQKILTMHHHSQWPKIHNKYFVTVGLCHRLAKNHKTNMYKRDYQVKLI